MREAAAQGANIILLQVRLGSARQHACCRITAGRPLCISWMLTLQMHAQELFATPYFCQEQTEEHFKIAQVRFCSAAPTEHVLANVQHTALTL